MFISFMLACILVLYLYYWSQKRAKDPPCYPGHIPLLGHLTLFFGDNRKLYKTITSLAEFTTESGGVALFYMGTSKFYLITDPDDFITAGNTCLRKHALYSFFKPWVGDGIITTLHLSIWKRHRKLLSPSLKQQVLDTFIKRFNINSNKLLADFSAHVDKGPFCHTKYLERRGLETICQTGLGFKEDDYLFDKETYFQTLSKLLTIIIQRSKKFYQHSSFIFNLTKDGYDMKQCVNFMNNVSNQSVSVPRTLRYPPEEGHRLWLKLSRNQFIPYHVIKKKRENLSNEDYNCADKRLKPFMDLAIDYMEEGVLSKQEILDEVNTLIAAGYETSSTALTFTLLCLGTYKHVQDKAYEEFRKDCTYSWSRRDCNRCNPFDTNRIQSVFEGSMRDVEKTDLAKLVYVEAVIKETLRLYSVVPLMLRYVDTEVKLKNYTMEAGSSVVMMTNGLHLHPAWGAAVQEFRPERWLEAADEDSAVHRAYAPFGNGKRLCIGRTYSYMFMKVVIASVLRKYKISADISAVELAMLGVIKPSSNNEITVELR